MSQLFVIASCYDTEEILTFAEALARALETAPVLPLCRPCLMSREASRWFPLSSAAVICSVPSAHSTF